MSWWVGLSREEFAQRMREEHDRLQNLTHDSRLRPRGKTERPAIGQGRAPQQEE